MLDSVDNTSQARHQRAQKALEGFCAGKIAGPLPNSVWMGDGYVELRCFNSRIHVSGVFVLPENRSAKLGTAYMQELIRHADEHGAEIQCSISPFGEQVPGAAVGMEQLTKWYTRLGFEPHPGKRDMMVRMPVTAA